ncbi:MULTISPECIES: heavy-metal-associated domain-containing protein [Neobacillus]|uniref:Heavy-metal-associated domain-containing protein n=1 Tax=Neobacillus citreus TaxID=2833578 RepID=A0A942YDT3_9BACI|nr:heavy-metal-associated domain-containing protein [Neobacillus citreus]MCH6267546.1 heavy-metal-associated domain-containing protein [Neobacillus citreus]
MKKAVFQLEPLTCPSCIKKIETTLQKTPGVRMAKVIFNMSKVKAEFNESEVNANQLEEKFHKLGYEVISTKVS